MLRLSDAAPQITIAAIFSSAGRIEPGQDAQPSTHPLLQLLRSLLVHLLQIFFKIFRRFKRLYRFFPDVLRCVRSRFRRRALRARERSEYQYSTAQ